MGKVKRASPAFIQRQGDAKKALGDVSKRVETAVTATGEAVEDALKKHADKILARSQELVPVDTGALKASGFAEVERNGDEIVAQVCYSSNGSVPYATFVHELPNAHTPPTQRKFLETAAQEVAGDIEPSWRKRLRMH